ncbi:hypothetical protein DC31_00030 [Microbacterium sp. CH12i]|uniref:hypothetical protein n=1 Tax=Microbacterium sp. CH12i TaxID=1479651 RepID=UPI000461FF96|nr:hypothetical protein [Microbacterium sp. CH12i]KDA07167.1 hypothetical protein DC31_00030 [Microbacterium sp. CH12i]
MTDITTTTAGLGEGAMALPQAPTVTDRRVGFSGELDRARNELAEAQRVIAERDAMIAQRDQTLATIRHEQITDGGDFRLTTFWERAGRIADAADFCQEYDRIAEAMNGPRRERDYDVTLRLTIDYDVSARGSDGDEAGDHAIEDFSIDALIEAARNGSLEILETEVYSTEES